MNSPYSKEFYGQMEDKNLISAREVVPFVLEYVQPKSVVDVGCGTGLWLKAFQENGVNEVTGIDGDWVKDEMLVIDKKSFISKNLEEHLHLDRTYDLAVSLEVAEHLEASKSDVMVDNLTSLSDVILFSAAIPLQGGIHHVNEQWPEYWDKKFRAKGYVPVDCIRRKIWDNEIVSYFYAQNIIIYVKEDSLGQYPKFEEEIKNGNDKTLALVHPKRYLEAVERYYLLIPTLGLIPSWIKRLGLKTLRLFKKGSLAKIDYKKQE
jgi:SAM-dependent methyltransferase